ncbi:MAG: N-acetylmuramoyl-L-alanine amidase, partial [Prevotella sp.]|nr:N-acetylmuramoyl-L-alanine amidase [Prevotella sp.]
MKYIRIILFLLFILTSIPGYSQNDKDTPRNGEGVRAFLQRNKRTQEDHYTEFLKLNKGKFGKGNTLLKGVKYTLPPISKIKED